MDSRPMFLDTNIYLGYALDARFEVFHDDCSLIFKVNRDRHTCETVRTELRTKEKDRQNLYLDLLKHLDSHNPPDQFNFRRLKESDQNHAKLVFELFSKSKLGLEYLRILGAELREGILSGLKKTIKPYVKESTDGQMKQHFELNTGIHYPDNLILTDFFDWAFPRTGSIFVTGDGGIHQKRGLIIQHVETCKGHCGHLDLQFIREAASKLRFN